MRVIDKPHQTIQAGLRSGQPNIFLALDRQGIDPFTQRFPVTLRYEGTVRGVGGLAIGADCATSVPGLYAAGDAASREDRRRRDQRRRRPERDLGDRLGRLGGTRGACLFRAPRRPGEHKAGARAWGRGNGRRGDWRC